jgi:succinoglycan biosynthesis protein ExoA
MTGALPYVSILMPVRNEAPFIRHTLAAALAQDYAPDRLEIIVIDGESDDGTVQQVKALAAGDDRVRLIANPGRIQSQALNLGLAAARGEVIVRVDGHSLIAPDYVRQCVHHLQATGAGNVGGQQRFAGLTPFGRAIAAAYRSPFGVPSHFTSGGPAGYVDTVYLGAWPRAALVRLGGFDTSLGGNEDYELNYRLRRAGRRVYFAPDIRSLYFGRQSLLALWQQFFCYGGWKFDMLRRHPWSVRPRHLAAPALVAALIIGAVLAPFNHGIARRWRRLLTGYGLAAALASVREARRSRDGFRLLARLPLVFSGMHLGWGTGFWVAALRRLGNRSS